MSSEERALMIAMAAGVLATMAAVVPLVENEPEADMSGFEQTHKNLVQAIKLFEEYEA